MDPASSTVYFLGAGATRADFPNVPLMTNLLHEMLRIEESDSFLVRFLQAVFDPLVVRPDSKSDLRPRLDDVFTIIDACLSGRAPAPADRPNLDLIAARRHLIASIGRVIAQTVGSGRGALATRFAKQLPANASTIISTNYDIVMDNALWERDPPNVNYGVTIRAAVERSGPVPTGRTHEMRHFGPAAGQSGIRQGPIPLLKLHGSLNWLYCPRCDELDITPLTKGAVTILDQPELGRCSEGRCTCSYETVLVGPSLEQRYERRVLRETWAKAEEALRSATNLVVIGYSLPEADYLIRAMLARTFSQRSRNVFVVAKEAGGFEEDVFEQRYRRLFPECDFELYGFEAYLSSVSPETQPPITRSGSSS